MTESTVREAPAAALLGPALALEPDGEQVQGFRRRVRGIVETGLAPLVVEAERTRRFPRSAVAELGAAGIFRDRWSGGSHGDLGRAVIIAEELGRACLGGIGVGVSLHMEAAVSILRRFARTAAMRDVLEAALNGRYLCCVATSEEHAGSDLAAVTTTLEPVGGHWRVRGTKWFVSPGPAADVALVLCRADAGLAIAVVSADGLRLRSRLPTTGMRSLETARIEVDALISDDAVLARPGFGLPAITWGLLHERLAIAAQVFGCLDLALTLTVTHLHRRLQFGVPLYDHQALRLRMADLVSRVRLARRGLHAMVAELDRTGAVSMREVAGAKVTAARLGQEVVSECMHLFGGKGYLEDETPLPRMWRDLSIGRLGAGSDEMMWELVAAGMPTDEALYCRWITS